MVNRSSTPNKRQASGPNLLSLPAKRKDGPTAEQGRRGAVTGRKAGAQKRPANQKREIARRAERARWSQGTTHFEQYLNLHPFLGDAQVGVTLIRLALLAVVVAILYLLLSLVVSSAVSARSLPGRRCGAAGT